MNNTRLDLAHSMLYTLVCAMVAGILYPSLLYLFDRTTLSMTGQEDFGGPATVTVLNVVIWYTFALQFLRMRWLRALLSGFGSAIGVLMPLILLQMRYFPDLFSAYPITCAEFITFQFVAVYIASLLTDSMFGIGMPLQGKGKAIAFCGLLAPMLFVVAHALLGNWELINVLAGNRFVALVLCLTVGIDATISFALALAIEARLAFSKHLTRLLTATLTAIAYYAQIGLVSSRQSFSLDAFLAVTTPVFMGTIAACWILWFLVLPRPQPPAPVPPQRRRKR